MLSNIATYDFTCAIRLTPLYMLVLAIYTTLFKYFGSGPFWPKESDEACINNWWTNLLYINNVVHHDSPVIVVMVLRNSFIHSYRTFI